MSLSKFINSYNLRVDKSTKNISNAFKNRNDNGASEGDLAMFMTILGLPNCSKNNNTIIAKSDMYDENLIASACTGEPGCPELGLEGSNLAIKSAQLQNSLGPVLLGCDATSKNVNTPSSDQCIAYEPTEIDFWSGAPVERDVNNNNYCHSNFKSGGCNSYFVKGSANYETRCDDLNQVISIHNTTVSLIKETLLDVYSQSINETSINRKVHTTFEHCEIQGDIILLNDMNISNVIISDVSAVNTTDIAVSVQIVLINLLESYSNIVENFSACGLRDIGFPPSENIKENISTAVTRLKSDTFLRDLVAVVDEKINLLNITDEIITTFRYIKQRGNFYQTASMTLQNNIQSFISNIYTSQVVVNVASELKNTLKQELVKKSSITKFDANQSDANEIALDLQKGNAKNNIYFHISILLVIIFMLAFLGYFYLVK